MAKEVNKWGNILVKRKEVENNIKSIRGAMAQLTDKDCARLRSFFFLLRK